MLKRNTFLLCPLPNLPKVFFLSCGRVWIQVLVSRSLFTTVGWVSKFNRQKNNWILSTGLSHWFSGVFSFPFPKSVSPPPPSNLNLWGKTSFLTAPGNFLNCIMAWPLHGMVRGKVFVEDTRERTARGIEKSTEEKEKVIDWTWPTEWIGPWEK